MRVLPLAALLAAACGAGKPSTSPATAQCTGQAVAIVTNDWNEAVEAYARTPDNPRASLLARVNAGEQIELVLTGGANGVTIVPARAIEPSYTPPAMRQLVRIRYVCR